MRMGGRLGIEAVAAMSMGVATRGAMIVAGGALLCVAPAWALSPAPVFQEHTEPSEATPADAARLETVRRELARIEVSFRVDADATKARDDLARLVADSEKQRVLLADTESSATYDRLNGDVEAALNANGESISDVVRSALERQDLETLDQLGPRAIDELQAELLRKAGQQGPQGYSRPLYALLQLAPETALELLGQPAIADRLPSEGVLLALLNSELWNQNRWSFVPGRTPQYMFPALIDQVVTRLDRADLKASAQLRQEVNAWLAVLTRQDAMTQPLTETFARIALAEDRRSAQSLLNEIQDDIQTPSVQPLLERLMSHPDELVRASVARRLFGYCDSRTLRAHVGDSSADVRLCVAWLLRPKIVRTQEWKGRDDSFERVQGSVRPDEDAEARAILTTLATDSDPRVREAAVGSIALLQEPLDQQVYLTLADDPDPGVRAALAGIKHRDEEFETELLSRLVRHGDAPVVDSVLQRLSDLAAEERNVERVMKVLRAMPRVVQPGYQDPLQFVGTPLVAYPNGRNALTRWTLETGDHAPLSLVVRLLGKGPNYGGRLDNWLELQPDELRRLFTLLAESEPLIFPDFAHVVATHISDAAPEAMRPIFEDESQPVLVRLAAGAAAVRKFDARLEETLVKFLASEAIRTWQPRKTQSGMREEAFLSYLADSLPDADQNRVLLRLLTESALPDSLQPWLLDQYNPQAPDANQLTELILRRWGAGPDQNWSFLQKAVEHAGSLRGQLDPQLLIAATRNSQFAAAAVRSMARQHDVVYLDTLKDCLRPDWLSDDWSGAVTKEAIDALTFLMSDDAARILLQGAAETTEDWARDKCLAAVDTIRRYQEALADWERRGTARATRDTAIVSLAAQADDSSPEVRAYALRALVSLRAVEYLPRIIQALKDEDQGVREAARESLDRQRQLEAEEDHAHAANGAGEAPTVQPAGTSPSEGESKPGGG